MSFFESLLGGKKSGAPIDAKYQPLLEAIVEVLGPEVTQAKDYAQQLTPVLDIATQYFERQVAAIPGPINLAALAYGNDPFLRAAFPDAGEITMALGRSVDVREALPKLAEKSQLKSYALMGMRTRDREPVAGEPVVLADHTLTCLGASEAAVRGVIRQTAFLRVLKNYNVHLDKLRVKGKLLPEEWNIENSGNHQVAHADKRHQIFDDYIYADQALTPDNLLRGLVAWLEKPEQCFRVADSGVVLRGQGSNGNVLGYPLPMLHAADRRRWMAVLVEFSTEEGLRALAQESRTHRYILL